MKEGLQVRLHGIAASTNVAIFFLMFCCSPGKTGKTNNTTQLDSVKKYVEPRTSKVNTIGDTTITQCLKNDCSEGIKRFYIKGNLNAESYFRDNERFLINKNYYENNGPLAQIDTIIDFKMVGVSVSYFPNGQLQKTTRRDKNGVEIGPYQSYYENGQPKLTVRYADGKRHGEMIEYYENGKVMQRGEFKENKRHGVWRMYDVQGNLIEEKNYNNGVELK